MPSKTPAQRKLMSIAAHTPGGYGGVPQSVGQDFHAADRGKWGARTMAGTLKTKATKKTKATTPRRFGRLASDPGDHEYR